MFLKELREQLRRGCEVCVSVCDGQGREYESDFNQSHLDYYDYQEIIDINVSYDTKRKANYLLVRIRG